MIIFSRCIVIAFVLLSPLASLCADDMAGLIEQLNAPRFAERQEAYTTLWSRGESILPDLLAYPDTSSKEVTARIGQLIFDIECGIQPATPRKLANALRELRTGDLKAQTDSVLFLMWERKWEEFSVVWGHVPTEQKLDIQKMVRTTPEAIFASRLDSLADWTSAFQESLDPHKRNYFPDEVDSRIIRRAVQHYGWVYFQRFVGTFPKQTRISKKFDLLDNSDFMRAVISNGDPVVLMDFIDCFGH